MIILKCRKQIIKIQKVSRYKSLLLMNLKYDLEQLLPDELEKLVLFINNLFNDKIKKRLTNQDYQKIIWK